MAINPPTLTFDDDCTPVRVLLAPDLLSCSSANVNAPLADPAVLFTSARSLIVPGGVHVTGPADPPAKTSTQLSIVVVTLGATSFVPLALPCEPLTLIGDADAPLL